MAEVIRMPKMSDTMEEGVIASWLKKVGDPVKSGDILAEVETDKATMELESYNDGVLLHIGVKEKDTVPIEGVIAIIGEKGEDISSLIKQMNNESSASDKAAPEAAINETKPSIKVDTSSVKAAVIRMPKMSDTMVEGVISTWLKNVGDQVASGDVLAEVETDKATMELESYEEGILLYRAVEPGNAVLINGIIAIVGDKGADFNLLLQAESTEIPEKKSVSEEKKVEPQIKESVSPAVNPVISSSSNGRILASPLAKKLAEDKGIDLKTVQGSGDGGRIVRRDIENYVPSTKPSSPSVESTDKLNIQKPAIVGQESSEDIPVSQMRKVIAKRLSESKFTAPHFYLTMEIVMDKAIDARKSMNELSPVKISFNDLIIKAVAASLRQHPDVNVSWMGDKLQKHHHIHIGVAVAIPDGLVVPVVRFADSKSLSHISAEVKELANKAINKKLQPDEFSGNTFSISNLGMFGIDEFTAIINPPDACILAVGGIKETVIVKNGKMKAGNVMKVTMSCDHRAVDGAVGSAFLQTLKGLLEDPVRILI